MAGVNKVILLGFAGNDPEIRHLEGGASVAGFRLATTEYYRDKNGQRIEQTEWHNVVAWRGLAEVVEKLIHKGTQVYIEGKLRTRQWEDKDRNKRYTTEIIADVVNIIQHKKDDTGHQAPPSSPQESSEPSGDLPF